MKHGFSIYNYGRNLIGFEMQVIEQHRLESAKSKRKSFTQFRIRNLLLFVATVAAACGVYVVARNIYYSDRRQTEFALAHVKGISSIQLHSHVDFTEEVNSSRFAVDAHPGSIVSVGGLTRYLDEGRFWLCRIGKWKFRISGRRHLGTFNVASGETVESEYFGGCIELGPNSPYKHLFPFEVNTLQDLADHYGDLVELLETWPREGQPGSVTLEDGTTQYYFVVEQAE